MSTAVSTESVAEASPRFKARTAGVFWLLTILTGTFAMLVYGRLVVAGNPAASASNLSAHEALFRMGVAAALIATACYFAATLLVYAILKPVDRNVSLLAALFSVAGFASAAVSFAFRLAPLIVLGGAQSLNLFTVEQLQALVLTFLRLSARASNVSFVLFGLHCLLAGYLILLSSQRARGIVRVFKNWLQSSTHRGGTTNPQPR